MMFDFLPIFTFNYLSAFLPREEEKFSFHVKHLILLKDIYITKKKKKKRERERKILGEQDGE